MKLANIVTNVVLGAAVVVLFVLHFTGGEKSEGNGEHAASTMMADPSDISIAYFNMDSVMSQWDLYFEYQQEYGFGTVGWADEHFFDYDSNL